MGNDGIHRHAPSSITAKWPLQHVIAGLSCRGPPVWSVPPPPSHRAPNCNSDRSKRGPRCIRPQRMGQISLAYQGYRRL